MFDLDTNNSPASSGEADKLTVISVAPKTRIQGLGTEKKRDHSPVLPVCITILAGVFITSFLFLFSKYRLLGTDEGRLRSLARVYILQILGYMKYVQDCRA